jgi:RimJ/RimL family protein N-acetyltransferase
MKANIDKKQKETARIDHGQVSLVPFTEDFLTPVYVGWLNDAEVVKYSRQRFSTHTIESCRSYLDHMNKSGDFFRAILDRKSERHIGNISASIDRQNSVADIAIMIGECMVWGKGYGLDAWVGAMDYLHNEVGIRMVTGGCMATNKGMMRVMEKSGMKHYYTRTRYFLDQGSAIDSVHYASIRTA